MVDDVHAESPEADPEELAEEEGGSGIPMTASESVAEEEDDELEADEAEADDIDSDDEVEKDTADSPAD